MQGSVRNIDTFIEKVKLRIKMKCQIFMILTCMVCQSCTWTNAKRVSVVQNFELNWSRICFSFVLNHAQAACFRECAPASSSASPVERVTVNGWLLHTREQRRNVPKTWAVWRKTRYGSEGQ